MTSLLDWRILEALEDTAWLGRFHARLNGWPTPGRCWIWTGAIDERGFGRVRLPGDVGGTAHPQRVTWLENYGEVQPGMVLHKKPAASCAGRRCANHECWFEGPVGRLPWWIKRGFRAREEVTTWNGDVKHGVRGGR